MTTSGNVRANLALLRRVRGMTQASLAKRTDDTDTPVTRGTIANIEAGVQRTVNVDQLVVLAEALAVKPAALLAEPRSLLAELEP